MAPVSLRWQLRLATRDLRRLAATRSISDYPEWAHPAPLRLMNTALRLSLLALVPVLGASCRSTSIAYHFTPSPAEVLVQEAPEAPIVARVLIGVPGAERDGGRSSGHPELLARVRIENKSDLPMQFDPSTAVLVGSDLAEFGAPKAIPPGVTTVAGGDARSILLRFPFPFDGSLEAPLLTGVNLQFELRHPSGDVEVSSTLERFEPEVIQETTPAFAFGTGWYYGW